MLHENKYKYCIIILDFPCEFIPELIKLVNHLAAISYIFSNKQSGRINKTRYNL